MRVHLELVSLEAKPIIPVNYNHLLSQAILKTLSQAEPEYQVLLRERGLKGHFYKRFRLFTFSSLQFHGPRWNLEEGDFHFDEPAQASLIISFSHERAFVEEHLLPLIEGATFVLERPGAVPVSLHVRSMEVHPFPALHAGTYKVLSPVTITRKSKDEVRYLSPRSFETGQALAENLVEKYELLTGERLPPSLISIKVDAEYLARSPHPMKVITIDEGGPQPARVRAFMAPIQLEGDPRLIQMAFACGLGERNFVGFGLLAEPTKKHHRPIRSGNTFR